MYNNLTTHDTDWSEVVLPVKFIRKLLVLLCKTHLLERSCAPRKRTEMEGEREGGREGGRKGEKKTNCMAHYRHIGTVRTFRLLVATLDQSNESLPCPYM